MEKKFLSLLLIALWSCFETKGSSSRSPKTVMQVRDVPELIRFDGYPVEVHHAVTEDGYILELHRIPAGRNETHTRLEIKGRKKVVLLAHCAFCSSAAFVVLGPNGGLAYMLANSGYDVWMLNARGTSYSRRHVNLSPESRKFWQFSWHEQGTKDFPAGIDYILKETGEKKVNAIGFSMGTTHLFTFLSEKPEYNEKIRTLIMLAPAVYVGNSRTRMVQIFNSFGNKLIHYGASTGQLEVAGRSSGLRGLISRMCTNSKIPLFRSLCDLAVELMGGGTSGNINRRTLPFYFNFFPDSVSLRTMIHFWQIQKTGRFCKYDFGRTLNNKVYKNQIPPDYDLSNVRVPVNIIWSQGDNVVVAEDIKKLMKVLPNLNSTHEVPDKLFSHVDFIWGKTAHVLVNKEILKLLN